MLETTNLLHKQEVPCRLGGWRALSGVGGGVGGVGRPPRDHIVWVSDAVLQVHTGRDGKMLG